MKSLIILNGAKWNQGQESHLSGAFAPNLAKRDSTEGRNMFGRVVSDDQGDISLQKLY